MLGIDFYQHCLIVILFLFQFEKLAREELQRAFTFDGLISSHPLYVPVGHPDEINEIFDTISYSKVLLLHFDMMSVCHSVCSYDFEIITCVDALFCCLIKFFSHVHFNFLQGASVIRMMRQFIGLETFRRGLTVCDNDYCIKDSLVCLSFKRFPFLLKIMKVILRMFVLYTLKDNI